MKRICLTTLVLLGLATGLSAQIQSGDNIPAQPAKPVTPGELNPYFWIGGQAVTVLGKNLETGAAGMSYSNNQSWLSFNVAFVDSHYDVPKKVVSTDDPEAWSVSFKLTDLTGRINSYSSSAEINYPSWSVGVKGFGWTAGLKSVGGDTANKPATALIGANQVLYLGQQTAGSGSPTATDVLTRISVPVSGAAFAGYEVSDRYKITATVGSKITDETKTKSKSGWAAVLDFKAAPWGQASFDEPLALSVQGNVIGSQGYAANPFGFGVQVQADYVLDDDIAVSPLAAFDAKYTDTWTSGVVIPDGAYSVDWKAGFGLMVSLSQKQWAGDQYSELPSQATFANVENAKIQKFTYVQAVADVSRQKLSQTGSDVDLIFKAEEPDGILGLDDNLGAMAEFRVGNALLANEDAERKWSTVGRVTYDFASHTLSPYVRWSYNSERVVKARVGALWAPLKGFAVELTYMSANLNSAVQTPRDKGRLELLLGISTDTSFRMMKNMSFNYEGIE